MGNGQTHDLQLHPLSKQIGWPLLFPESPPELADAEVADEFPAGADDSDRADAGPLHSKRRT